MVLWCKEVSEKISITATKAPTVAEKDGDYLDIVKNNVLTTPNLCKGKNQEFVKRSNGSGRCRTIYNFA